MLPVCLAAWLAVPLLRAQAPPQPRFKAEVKAALYELSVRDSQGLPIKGLDAEDFRVLEDGEPRPVILLEERGTEPVSLAILLDTGSSMNRRSIRTGRELAFRLIHLLGPADRIALATYDHQEPYFLCRLTSDRYNLLEGIRNIHSGARPSRLSLAGRSIAQGAALGLSFSPADSQTGLAVDMALRQLRGSPGGNKVVLAISSGFNSLGEATLEHLHNAGARFFAVSFSHKIGDILSLGASRAAREKIVRQTGGASIPGHLALELAQQLRDAMKSLYLIAYQPGEGKEGEARKVEFHVLSRPGCRIVAVPPGPLP